MILYNSNRGVAQVVAHQTGGLGVASSSLVTPTIANTYELLIFKNVFALTLKYRKG